MVVSFRSDWYDYHRAMASWNLADMPSQIGKRFLITGANSGIGYAAAVALAEQGAIVMLACRDRARGEEALRKLRTAAAGPGSAAEAAELLVLDLASLASVEAVAEELLGRGNALDGLINNAGVFGPRRRKETIDGFELVFGTNVLGHFALTCRLRPALERAAAGRVVTLASLAHKVGKIDFDDLQLLDGYRQTRAYYQSKLGDLMFAFRLEAKLRERASRVMSLAVHPGVARSNIFKIGSSEGMARWMELGISRTIGIFFNSFEEGALPTLFAATAEEAVAGVYYGPQGFREMRGGDVGPARVAKQASDVRAQERLWTLCEELTGCALD